MKSIGKTILILFVHLASLQGMKAQDVIITKSGDIRQAYNLEISSSAVFYKTENSDSSAIQRLEKCEIYMIKHADGTKTIFNDNMQAESTAETSNSSRSSFGLPDEARNATLLGLVNDQSVSFVGKKKSGQAKRLFCQFGIAPSSQLANKDVELHCAISSIPIGGDIGLFERMVSVTVKNLTTHTLFIDLGNSFFTRGHESTSYYVPTSTSNTSGGSTGLGINMGAVSSALGVGGVVGQIASGTTVGGEKTHSTTTTTYSQRIVSIPPMSSKSICKEMLFPVGCEVGYDGYISSRKSINYRRYFQFMQRTKCEVGETLSFTPDNSPVTLGVFVTYSFDENCNESANMRINYYVNRIIGYSKLNGIRKEVPYQGILSGITKHTLYYTAATNDIW